MEFDNCLEYEGPVAGGDRREIEVNQFGKPLIVQSKNLNRVTINNTKYDAMVSFKLCLGSGSKTTKAATIEGTVVA